MKKTMFITSVIMVVVMAIALTTSSLAWFTAAGSSVVTTTALTIQAQASSSSGIQISVDGATSNFRDQVTLSADSAISSNASSTNMMPLFPLTGTSTAASYAAEAVQAIAAGDFIGNYVTEGILIDAQGAAVLQTGDSVPTAHSYFAYSSEGGASPLYAASGAVSAYVNGFFADNIWIANLAAGSAAKAVTIQPAVSFKIYDAENSAYVNFTNNTTQNANGATFYVAVLALEDYDEDPDTDDTWGLVQLFSNAGTYVGVDTDAKKKSNWVVSTINVGKEAENFASGELTDSAWASNITLTKVNGGSNSIGLPAAVNGAARGTAKQFRVVAWYDADSLTNNNSAQANFQFELTFYATDVVVQP